MSESTLTLRFAEGTGAVDRIIGLLRRRGFPIAGMTLERTHADGVGRMTVVVDGEDHIEQVTRHLRRLPDVLEVTNAGAGTIQREYALARVHCTASQRSDLEAVIQQLRGTSHFHRGRVSRTSRHRVAVMSWMPCFPSSCRTVLRNRLAPTRWRSTRELRPPEWQTI